MRLQLDIDKVGVELLARLKRVTGSKTHKELFNNALALLNWAVKQRMEGRTIASIHERGDRRELQMPALEYAAGATEQRDYVVRETREAPEAVMGAMGAIGGRASLLHKSHEVREEASASDTEAKEAAAEYIARGKEAVARQRENLRAAVEAGKGAYREATERKEPSGSDS